MPRVPNCWGDAEKFQQCHKYFIQYSALASKRSQVRTPGRQTCFLPGASSPLPVDLRRVYLNPGHVKS